jgi:Bacterial Ig-like domain
LIFKVFLGLLIITLSFFHHNSGVSASVDSPTVVSLSPQPGTTDFNFKQVYSIEFDRAVNLDTGFFILRNSLDDSIIASFDVKSLFVRSEFKTVYLNPEVDLKPYTHLYVQVTEGAVVDVSGNPFPGILDNSWNFTGSEPEIQDLPIILEIDAPTNRSYKDLSFVRYEYSLKRSDHSKKIICKAKYTGIQNKPELYVFPVGSKEILMRFRLLRRQLNKLREIGSDHNITIDVTCSDGTSDSKLVKISI